MNVRDVVSDAVFYTVCDAVHGSVPQVEPMIADAYSTVRRTVYSAVLTLWRTNERS